MSNPSSISIRLPPSTTLRIAQQAPVLLRNQTSFINILSLPWLSQRESPELWTMFENLFLACLKTEDDESARLCLLKLTKRFGKANQRIMTLQGLYEEATAERQSGLLEVLKEYESALEDNPVNIPIAKRRISLLRSLSRPADAIAALVSLLDQCPTDAEGWCELSELYISQGMMPQAIFCLEEVLLIVPNAWNIQARLGEVQFLCATVPELECESKRSSCNEAARRFCRSIELCDDYTRGYYGLKLATGALLQNKFPVERKSQSSDQNGDEDLPPMDKGIVEKLNRLATSKLEKIYATSNMDNLSNSAKAEMLAVRELLDRDQATEI